jgi:hypothetical protein
MLYRVLHAWAGFELKTSVVVGTDCIGSCKSNYHAITTTTVPLSIETIALTKWCSRTRFFFLIPIHVVSRVRLYWSDVIIKTGCRCKWTREYSTIHFFRHLCCYSTIHGQCRVFNNDLKSYPKLRDKRPLSCSLFELTTIVVICNDCTVPYDHGDFHTIYYEHSQRKRLSTEVPLNCRIRAVWLQDKGRLTAR